MICTSSADMRRAHDKKNCSLASAGVFTTSTGAKLTPSHVNKIVTAALRGSASQIWKTPAGRYMCEDPKFVKVLSAKMQHTEATHSQWYEAVATRKDMHKVVQRINHDLCSLDMTLVESIADTIKGSGISRKRANPRSVTFHLDLE